MGISIASTSCCYCESLKCLKAALTPLKMKFYNYSTRRLSRVDLHRLSCWMFGLMQCLKNPLRIHNSSPLRGWKSSSSDFSILNSISNDFFFASLLAPHLPPSLSSSLNIIIWPARFIKRLRTPRFTESD